MRKRASPYTLLQEGTVYGPVDSRRLGVSVGINLFPGDKKICSLDCAYCFFPGGSYDLPDDLVNVEKIEQDLDAFLFVNQRILNMPEVYFTFSGNGEPTLHPNFASIVEKISGWKKRRLPCNGKLAIFSNSTQLHRQDVRDALLTFDKVFLKFDWGTPDELEQISRPRHPVTLDEIGKNIKILLREARSKKVRTNIILQTAIYTKHRSDEAWRKWADRIKDISPVEVSIYELDWPSCNFAPESHYDFHDLRRYISKLLENEPVKPSFEFAAPFYVNVDLCYAVDSLIYLPLYVAEYAQLFEQNEVRVNHFVSMDGDPGAVAAITRGAAQFAICDPQAAIDLLAKSGSDYNSRYEPRLVAVLIDRLALWCISATDKKKSPRDAILGMEKIVTYKQGSTASYVWAWQKERLQESTRPHETIEVTPGNEFGCMCNGDSSAHICVITADLLGARWCSSKSTKRHLSVTPYATTKFGSKFLFTGLLASRDVIERYPGAVDGVVKGLQIGVAKLSDERFMRKQLRLFTEFVMKILVRNEPEYLRLYPGDENELQGAVGSAIRELQQLEIYTVDGRLRHLGGLYNALMVRGGGTRRSSLPVHKVLFWVDKRAASFRMRFLMLFLDPLQWIASSKPFKLALVTVVFTILTALGLWLGWKKWLGQRVVWGVVATVFGNLAAATLVSWYISIRTQKGKEL